MHFFLPDAERWRRVLASGAVLAALTLLAWWRPPLAERAAARPKTRVSGATTRAAAPLLDVLVTPPAPVPLPALAEQGLAAWERAQGQPPEFPGVAWLEVPVLEHQRSVGRLRLAAGREHGLAVDQPVAFGDSWVGRVVEVGDGVAVVLQWNAPAARTGVWLRSEAADLRAVLLGVGRGGPPVVAWIDAGVEPHAGMEVRWRPRAGDPEGPGGALRLGRLEELEHRLPTDPAWCVPGALPSGAEGRVFVAAQAIGHELVAPPPLRRAAASGWLAADAVFGTRSVCVRQSEGLAATVVLQEGRVLGAVGARRGPFSWVARRTPAAWGEEALRLEDGAAVFTRGGGGIPRGLPLTPPPLPRSAAALLAVAPGRPQEAAP